MVLAYWGKGNFGFLSLCAKRTTHVSLRIYILHFLPLKQNRPFCIFSHPISINRSYCQRNSSKNKSHSRTIQNAPYLIPFTHSIKLSLVSHAHFHHFVILCHTHTRIVVTLLSRRLGQRHRHSISSGGNLLFHFFQLHLTRGTFPSYLRAILFFRCSQVATSQLYEPNIITHTFILIIDHWDIDRHYFRYPVASVLYIYTTHQNTIHRKPIYNNHTYTQNSHLWDSTQKITYLLYLWESLYNIHFIEFTRTLFAHTM